MSNVTSISNLYLQILCCHFCAVVIFLVGGWMDHGYMRAALSFPHQGSCCSHGALNVAVESSYQIIQLCFCRSFWLLIQYLAIYIYVMGLCMSNITAVQKAYKLEQWFLLITCRLGREVGICAGTVGVERMTYSTQGICNCCFQRAALKTRHLYCSNSSAQCREFCIGTCEMQNVLPDFCVSAHPQFCQVKSWWFLR